MHIEPSLFLGIMFVVAGVFFLGGYIIANAFRVNERENIMILEHGITDRDEQIKGQKELIKNLTKRITERT